MNEKYVKGLLTFYNHYLKAHKINQKIVLALKEQFETNYAQF
jgi:hypothetical protein